MPVSLAWALGRRPSRTSLWAPLFFHTADQIRAKFGDKVAIEMLNTTTGDGRGVVDMALGSNVQMAHDLKNRFNGAVEQTTSKRFQDEEKGGRRQWQRGDSDWKTHGTAKYRSDRAKWGGRLVRGRGVAQQEPRLEGGLGRGLEGEGGTVRWLG